MREVLGALGCHRKHMGRVSQTWRMRRNQTGGIHSQERKGQSHSLQEQTLERSVMMVALCTCYSHSEVNSSCREPHRTFPGLLQSFAQKSLSYGAFLLKIAGYSLLPSLLYFSPGHKSLADITYVPLACYLFPLNEMYVQFSWGWRLVCFLHYQICSTGHRKVTQ